MAKQGELIEQPKGDLLSRLGEMAEQLRPIIESIPEAGQDGEANIVLAILGATSLDDLDAPWNSAGLMEYVHKELTVLGIRRAESDFADGFGFFLLVDVVDPDTGGRKTLTTGSTAVVAQLVKVQALNAYPITVIPRIPDRPSKSGNFPMHLEVVRG